MARKGGAPENLKPQKAGEPGHNPYGRPKKTINVINQELEKLGYTEATKEDIISCYLRLIQITKRDLEGMLRKLDQPALVAVTAKAILSRRGFEIVEKMLDRGIGKAKESMDLNVQSESLIDVVKRLSDGRAGKKSEIVDK